MIKTDIVSEGGDREFNGKGTMMVNEAVELQRNPGMTRAQVEQGLLQILGQKKLIWLKRGVAEDDSARYGALYGNVYPGGTGGHMDEFCRFADAHTILLAEVSPSERNADPISRMNYERMEENYKILKRATDQDGKKFKIVRVPVVDLIYDEFVVKEDAAISYFHGSKAGDKIKVPLAASYLNFFISNGVVLTPAYWQEGRPQSMKTKDEAVKHILQRVFPDRKIVQIHSENFNYGGGGMHCATQQQPAIGLK